MSDAIFTLVGVIIGSVISAVISWINVRNNVKSQRLDELQSYRRFLMQEYLKHIHEYHQTYLRLTNRTSDAVTEEVLDEVRAQYSNMRTTLIQASYILRATGESEIYVVSHSLYNAALEFDLEKAVNEKDYNIFHAYRIYLDEGLLIFANVIAHTKLDLKKMPNADMARVYDWSRKELLKKKSGKKAAKM